MLISVEHFFLLICKVPTQYGPSDFKNNALGNYKNCPFTVCDHNVGEALQVSLVLLQFSLSLHYKLVL